MFAFLSHLGQRWANAIQQTLRRCLKSNTSSALTCTAAEMVRADYGTHDYTDENRKTPST